MWQKLYCLTRLLNAHWRQVSILKSFESFIHYRPLQYLYFCNLKITIRDTGVRFCTRPDIKACGSFISWLDVSNWRLWRKLTCWTSWKRENCCSRLKWSKQKGCFIFLRIVVARRVSLYAVTLFRCYWICKMMWTQSAR
jgi:hypothetical protein